MDAIRKTSLSWTRFAFVVVVVSLPFATWMLLLWERGEPIALLGLAFGWVWALVYAFHRWRALRKRFAGDGDAMVAAIRRDPTAYVTTLLRDGARWVVAATVVLVVFAVVMGLRGR